MSHTYQYGNTSFICNSDFSGPIGIYDHTTKERIEIESVEAILDFVANMIREKKVREVENLTTEQLLGL